MSRKGETLDEVVARVFKPGDAEAMERLCVVFDVVEEQANNGAPFQKLGLWVMISVRNMLRTKLIPAMKQAEKS